MLPGPEPFAAVLSRSSSRRVGLGRLAGREQRLQVFEADRLEQVSLKAGLLPTAAVLLVPAPGQGDPPGRLQAVAGGAALSASTSGSLSDPAEGCRRSGLLALRKRR